MATCFGLYLDHLQATFLSKRYNQCALCAVGSNITYRMYAKLIDNTKVYVNVKILLVRM